MEIKIQDGSADKLREQLASLDRSIVRLGKTWERRFRLGCTPSANRTRSPRQRAGSRRNKRLHNVRTFCSDTVECVVEKALSRKLAKTFNVPVRVLGSGARHGLPRKG